MKRKIADPTGGATHFFSPRSMKKANSYGPYKISGTKESVLIPYWALPKSYSKTSPPPSDWVITPFYQTIDYPTTEWVSGLENVRNSYFMFYRPINKPSITPATSMDGPLPEVKQNQIQELIDKVADLFEQIIGLFRF